MPDKIYSLEEALICAEKAKDYARSQIKKGYTQIENNDLENEYYNALHQAVRDMRKCASLAFEKESYYNLLEIHNDLSYFENTNAFSTKYSLGNCRELAMQALDYVLNNTGSAMRAEYYTIEAGDHAFLVLNRRHDSKRHDPKTWGECAVICDPWSNQVYQASDYLLKLRNYFYDTVDGRKYNHTEEFNPNLHLLKANDTINTDFFREIRTVTHLKESFEKEVSYLLKILENYRSKLSQEKNRIAEKYGGNDERIKILSSKIESIVMKSKNIRAISNELMNKNYDDNYLAAKDDLFKNILTFYRESVFAMQFNDDTLSKLFKPRGNGIQIQAMRFFGFKSSTQSHIEEIIEHTNQSLRKKKF